MGIELFLGPAKEGESYRGFVTGDVRVRNDCLVCRGQFTLLSIQYKKSLGANRGQGASDSLDRSQLSLTVCESSQHCI